MPGFDIARFRTTSEHFHCQSCDSCIDHKNVVHKYPDDGKRVFRTTRAQCEHCNIIWEMDCVLDGGGWRPVEGSLQRVTDKKEILSFSAELAKRLGRAA